MQKKVQSRVQRYEQISIEDEIRAGERERDRVLDVMEQHRPQVVAALQAEAERLWRELGRPLSANDVRPVLARIGYDGDPRILRHAFPRGKWRVVGWAVHNAPGNHARRICTFEPCAEASVKRSSAA